MKMEWKLGCIFRNFDKDLDDKYVPLWMKDSAK